MDTFKDLARLPLLPRDKDGPVFAAPWQAQAFAAVVQLTDTGVVTREEWSERLGAVLREAEARGEVDTGARYYEHWLTALERLAVEKSLAGWDDLAAEREAIRAADEHRREDQLGHGHDHGHSHAHGHDH
jgi:nitrile hydratase accessory protein